jgi:hypothetical protein
MNLLCTNMIEMIGREKKVKNERKRQIGRF